MDSRNTLFSPRVPNDSARSRAATTMKSGAADQRSADPNAPSDSPSTILLLLDLQAPSNVAIDRAASLASSRGALIDVVAIAPRGWRRWEHRPTVLARFALALGGSAVELVRHLDVRTGSACRAAFAAARRRPPDLVIAAEATDLGAPTVLADMLGVPVLVARARHASDSILAATALDDLDDPVPDTGADPVVIRSRAMADAILEVARTRDADLIVISYRRRSWLRRRFRGHMVDDIVARCRRSVLVFPIGR